MDKIANQIKVRNYGIPMRTYPLKTLFDENIICGERDVVGL